MSVLNNYYEEQLKSGVGAGLKNTSIKLDPGTYIFHSIVAKTDEVNPMSCQVTLRREVGGEDYKYTTLDGGMICNQHPLSVRCPLKIVITGAATLFSIADQSEATSFHYLDIQYEKVIA